MAYQRVEKVIMTKLPEGGLAMKLSNALESFRCFLGTKAAWAITLSGFALGAYLMWAHTGHLVSALPYFVFLLCPLMHLFSHHQGRGRPREDHQA
jgi:hypothetical protein